MLEIGYGHADITPPLGISLGGYGFYLDRRAERILDRLMVRALALRSSGTSAMMISLDLVGLSVEKADQLRQRVAEACELPTEHVMVACTHTHSAPLTQDLPGLGEVDASYVELVERSVVQAAEFAWDDLRPTTVKAHWATVEPIGYNRRRSDFVGIDPVLKTLIFERKQSRVFLFNYACHLVTLGRTPFASPDWAGSLIRQVERRGDHGVFFQGFCGDIDPVVNLDAWASGSPEDVGLYGSILAHRALHPFRQPEEIAEPELVVAEKRVSLPLKVGRKNDIDAEAERFLRWNRRFPNADRFAREWAEKAREAFDRVAADPYVHGVPIQVISVGSVQVLALPAEAFCEIGLQLQRRWPRLIPVGYANGDVGYIPTRDAYDDPSDYAAHCAPKFYALFPFVPDVSEILIREVETLLASVAG